MNLNATDGNGQPWNDAVLHSLGASSIAYPTDGTGRITGVIVTPDIDVSGYTAALAAFIKQGLVSYAASTRYNKEVGGITVGGDAIATDDRSKQMIMGARMAAQANGAFTTPWVLADGSVVDLNAAQVIAISDAVLSHVQACFTAFATVKSGIDAGTVTTAAQIDAAFAAMPSY